MQLIKRTIECYLLKLGMLELWELDFLQQVFLKKRKRRGTKETSCVTWTQQHSSWMPVQLQQVGSTHHVSCSCSIFPTKDDREPFTALTLERIEDSTESTSLSLWKKTPDFNTTHTHHGKSLLLTPIPSLESPIFRLGCRSLIKAHPNH